LRSFLDSDFWHGRNYGRLAPRMSDFWRAKIERNMERDDEVNRQLRRDGWLVIRLGERELKRNPLSGARKIEAALQRRVTSRIIDLPPRRR
jgi:G:T-mismatch repair DNA endonuclease (very short patch repair protein)